MVMNFPNNISKVGLRLHPKAFPKMRGLKMLKTGNMGCLGNVSEVYDKLNTLVWHGNLSKFVLSNQLRIMEWCGCPLKSLPYPLKCLPAGFEPDKLVELSMPFCPIEQLWKDRKVGFLLKQMCILLLLCRMLYDLLAYNRLSRI
jgi:hypothetical protein